MRKINLKARNVTSNTSSSGGASGRISLTVGIIVLIVAGGLFGGATYLKKSQDKKITEVKKEIKALKRSLDTNKDFKAVYDFHDRLRELSSIEKEKIKQIDVLEQLAQSTLGDNAMKTFKVTADGGKSEINATLFSPDLATVAKQVNAYKNISIQNKTSLKNVSAKDGIVEMTTEFVLPKINSTKER